MSKVYHSPITNARFSDRSEYADHLAEYLGSWIPRIIRYMPGEWKTTPEGHSPTPATRAVIKLLRDQYKFYREQCFATSSFTELATWLNNHMRILFAAPSVAFGDDVEHYQVEFINATEIYEPEGYTYEYPFFVEVYGGKMWEADMLVRPVKPGAKMLGFRYALASYGIYTRELQFFNDAEFGRRFELKVHIPVEFRNELVNDTVAREENKDDFYECSSDEEENEDWWDDHVFG